MDADIQFVIAPKNIPHLGRILYFLKPIYLYKLSKHLWIFPKYSLLHCTTGSCSNLDTLKKC